MEKIDFNKPTLERDHPIVQEGGEGTQKIWRFENGYGASVVRFSIKRRLSTISTKIGSYGVDKGLWEMAVIKFNGHEIDDFELCYDTEITSDVIGYLTEKDVLKYLKKIQKLKKVKGG